MAHLRLHAKQAVYVFDQVEAYELQMLQNLRQVGKGALQLVDGQTDGQGRHLPVDVPNRLAALLVQLGKEDEGFLQLMLHLLKLSLDLLSLLLRELVEDLRLYHLRPLQGRKRKTHGSPKQGEALFARFLADRLQGLALALLILLVDRLYARAVVLGLKGRRDRGSDFIHQLVERGLQLAPPPPWQRHCVRLVLPLEIVQIDPVARRFLGRGLRAKFRFHKRMPPGPCSSVHEDIVARMLDRGAEADRFQRPVLAGRYLQHLQVGGGLELEVFCPAMPAKRIDGQGVASADQG